MLFHTNLLTRGTSLRASAPRCVFWILLTLLIGACGQKAPERDARAVLVDAAGVAIEGYDPVAYHTDAAAVKGSAEFTAEWDGASWWFSSAEHRDLFVASPEAYAPAYGGWCAYGMAEGYAAETDPANGWTVHEGQLYLNWDAEVTAEWRADVSAYLEKSEPNWPGVRKGLDRGDATVYWHES